MNHEITYFAVPKYIWRNFQALTKQDLKEIDELAELMINPDGNHDNLVEVWNSKQHFRILKGLSTKYNL